MQIQDINNNSEKYIRFLCISDTHNLHDKMLDDLIPANVLIHCGDFSQTGTIPEIQKYEVIHISTLSKQ
jgi:predicted phosphodiesterase